MAPKVAEDIVSYCTSCGMDLVHTVVAVHGDKVVRVLCRTCKKEHAFRLPAALRAAATKKRTGKGASPGKARSATEWAMALERMKSLAEKPYTQSGLYEAGDKLEHAVFGQGLVTKLIAADKMEVLFEEGRKLLVRGSARKASG